MSPTAFVRAALLAASALATATPLAALADPAAVPEAAGAVDATDAATIAEAGDPAETRDGPIGEVLVTARRRAEAAQDVPIAISVLDGAALEAAGAFNVGRLTQPEPTLQFFSTNPRNTAINIRGLDATLRAEQELGGASLRAEWNLGEGALTSMTAWRFWNWLPANDRDFTGLPITTKWNNPSKQDQYTQEFRYAWANDRVDFVVGLFGFRQELTTAGIQEQGPAASRWLLNPASAAAKNPATLNGLRSINDIRFSNTSAAAFGQLDWKVTERLRVQPGIRVDYDDKDGSYVATVTNGTNTALTADQRGVLGPQAHRATFDDRNLSYDLTLPYELGAGVLGFAKYARHFKSGGINLAGLPLDAANNPITTAATVEPEEVNHFELGLKSQFFDGRATANVAAFLTKIDDYQANVRNAQLAVLRGYLASAEAVSVQGIEVDFSIRPSSPAARRRRPGRPSAHPARRAASARRTATSSGQWLPGISEWAASYGAEYHMPVAAFGGGETYVGFDGNDRSRFSSNASRSLYTDIDAYSIKNFRFGYRSDDARRHRADRRPAGRPAHLGRDGQGPPLAATPGLKGRSGSCRAQRVARPRVRRGSGADVAFGEIMAAHATESTGMKLTSLTITIALIVMSTVASLARADDGIRRETVKLARGASSAQIKARLEGRETIDYVIRAAAGQTLRVSLKGKSNPQNYFNVLPPGSNDVAMFVGSSGGDAYQGLLPADGDYLLRVYLMRAAGRRGEAGTFTLSVGVTGQALVPTPAVRDALVPGTPYHASGTIQCRPAFEPALRDCEAFALRRSAGGTATIDVRSNTGTRSILFVDGKPMASNGLPADPLGSERQGDVTIVKVGADERYEIPDALVSGG